MTTAEIRLQVAAMYDAPRWKERVSRMPTNQIYAIYRRNLEKKKEEKPLYLSLEPRKKQETYQQLTIWDWMMEREVNHDAQGSN